MKKKSFEAYFTVEASFIIPIAFLLIVLMIQYGFFCYEKSISLQCCYLAALRTSNEWEFTEKQKTVYASKEAEKLLEERQLYPSGTTVDTEVSLLGIEVKTEGRINALFTSLRGDRVDGWDTDSKKSAGMIVPSQYIRSYYTVKKAGGENDGNN